MKQRRISQKQVKRIIENSYGFINIIANELSMSRNDAEQLIHKFNLQNDMIKAAEAIGDICETKLLEKILDGNLDAIRFVLTTRFQNRGYACVIGGNVMNHAVDDVTHMSDELQYEYPDHKKNIPEAIPKVKRFTINIDNDIDDADGF